MGVYQVYVDDSGTKEYADNPAKYGPRGKSRYFCFGSLLVAQEDGSLLADKIAAKKREVFGTADVEIKSNWLRNPEMRQAKYLAPFSLTEERLTAFVGAYYDLVGSTNCVAIAAIVDKVHMQDLYAPPRSPWYAPAAAYEALMQRCVLEVPPPHTLSVTIDDMSGATPKGHDYKLNLQAHHASLRAHGSRLVKHLNFGPLDAKIRFVNSAHSHLVQVADIIAYNVYRQFVDHGEAWEDQMLKSLPMYPSLAKMGGLFRHDGAGRIQGYGVVKFPLLKRVRWSYSDKKKDRA